MSRVAENNTPHLRYNLPYDRRYIRDAYRPSDASLWAKAKDPGFVRDVVSGEFGPGSLVILWLLMFEVCSFWLPCLELVESMFNRL